VVNNNRVSAGMNSRASSAATSRRARQDLVRLLFGQESTTSPASTSTAAVDVSRFACRSQALDYARYSYAELRQVYLQKLQQWHPDKQYSAKIERDSQLYANRHTRFVELQNAWDTYNELVKVGETVDRDDAAAGDGGNSSRKTRDFTMFGVGCSFSDNETERALRNEIMDQAGRGWFSSGALTAEATSSSSSSSSTRNGEKKTIRNNNGTSRMSLLDDTDEDVFEAFTAGEDYGNGNSTTDQTSQHDIKSAPASPTKTTTARRKSLVDAKFRPKSVNG